MLEQIREDKSCRRASAMLSDYVDGTLSARDMWEVEKHLADCSACSALAESTQRTVEALRSAETLDTAEDFMAKLHARLDVAGPLDARRTPLTALRDWMQDVRRSVNARPIPVISLGMASFIVVATLVSLGRPTAPISKSPVLESVSQEALDRHVAVTASNPFDDPVAAKLEADSNAENAQRPGTD